nr:D85 [uncultured bacterium]
MPEYWRLGSSAEMWWDGAKEEVRLWAERASGEKRLCRISREAIEDYFDNPQDGDACLTAAQRNFDRITDAFLLRLGSEDLMEPDGSVLVRTEDL